MASEIRCKTPALPLARFLVIRPDQTEGRAQCLPTRLTSVALTDFCCLSGDRLETGVRLNCIDSFISRRKCVPFTLSFGLPTVPLPDSRSLASLGAMVALASIGLIALLSDDGAATPAGTARGLELTAPPPPPPLLLRDMPPTDALTLNQRIPFSAENNFAAKPFKFVGENEAHKRAEECLALAVYYEAGNQDQSGQEAVAQVVLNRVRHPAFPRSICGVVFQGFERRTGCQFTFTCDGSLLRLPESRRWSEARRIAQEALAGFVFTPVGLATHYHANYVVPYWATSLEKNAQVGAHIFYRWPDGWGRPSAFGREYLGREADPTALRTAAIKEKQVWNLASLKPDEGVQFTVDPRLELLSVVQILATGTSSIGVERYAKDVHSYFVPEKDHRAVQLFRKLSQSNQDLSTAAAQAILAYSPPPNLATTKASSTDKSIGELVDALRDFAKSSEFNKFFAGHQPFYNSVGRKAETRVGLARAYWQTYTGVPLAHRDVLLTSLSLGGQTPCQTTGSDTAVPIASVGTLFGATDADIILSLEGPVRPISGTATKQLGGNLLFNDQLIRAVFARVAELTGGEKAGKAYLGAELRRGSLMVAPLDQRLREYEGQAPQLAKWIAFTSQLADQNVKRELSSPRAAALPSSGICRAASTAAADLKVASGTAAGS